MIFIGIDISKLTFDAAYFINKRYVHKQFSNNNTGFADLELWMNKSDGEVFACLEATGIYSFDLAQYLSQQKRNILVVNPIITHVFFKMELNRNKTDKADAKLIARYCKHAVLNGDFKSNRLEASTNKHTTRSIKRLQKSIANEIICIKKNYCRHC